MENIITTIKYFVYIRKSSDREDAQTLSIDAQKREIKKFSENHKLKIVGYFEESASAYKTGRPKFNEMLSQIEKGKANGILVYHLTRVARNSFDGGRVIYMMDEGSVREIRTPEKAYYSHTSDDKFMMQIHFAMAKKSSDDTSQYVKRDIQSKILKGEYPISAPIGYLNLDKYGRITGRRYDNKKQEILERIASEENRSLRRIEADPTLAPLIVEIYNLYATGLYSIDQLRLKSFEIGIRGDRSKTMFAKATLLRILSNPFYYGAIPWTGKIHEPEEFPEETRHFGIVEKKLFREVQDILSNKSRPRKQVHNHKYTGIVRCGECGCMITAELQKNVVYYRCTKKKKIFGINCSQKYLTEEDLENQIQREIKKYVIPEEFAVWALEVLNKNNERESSGKKAILAQQRKQLTQIEQQLSQLLKMKISVGNKNSEMLSDEEYISQKNEILEEKQILKEKIADIEQSSDNWLEQCEQFFDFAVNCEKKWENGSPEMRRMIFSLLFGSNATLEDKILHIKAEKPFFETALLGKSYTRRGRPGSNRRPSA
jgi:site-specific DNA recombinase